MIVFLDTDLVTVRGDHFVDVQTGLTVAHWYSRKTARTVEVKLIAKGQVVYEMGGILKADSVGPFLSTWAPLDPMAHA